MFGFEYFSGANVLIDIKGITALECCGLSLSINENKRPIYGYSSRFFDAVARGQVIVQGSLRLNYVHEDYLREVLTTPPATRRVNLDPPVSVEAKSRQVRNDFGVPTSNTALLKEIAANYQAESQVVEALKSLYWRAPTNNRDPFNPHDLYGGFNIRATFGERHSDTGVGRTGFYIQDVYIVGRGKQIHISEDVIVEEYPFIARNTQALYPEFQIRSQEDTQGNVTTSVVTPPNSLQDPFVPLKGSR
jgi:hypothetical protein